MSTIIDEIRAHIESLSEPEYAIFSRRIISNIESERIIGVRTPVLRKLAKQYAQAEEFLRDVPHKYHEENQLHSFIISGIKDYEKAVYEVECFLPYIDNWATCDQLSPKVFAKYKDDLYVVIQKWLKSDRTYTVRYGVGMLMEHYLDDVWTEKAANLVCAVKSDEYYVNMMRAWFFATALAKQRSCILPYIENNALDVWTHNKTIQKSIESYRISDSDKEHLRSLKIKE